MSMTVRDIDEAVTTMRALADFLAKHATELASPSESLVRAKAKRREREPVTMKTADSLEASGQTRVAEIARKYAIDRAPRWWQWRRVRLEAFARAQTTSEEAA